MTGKGRRWVFFGLALVMTFCFVQLGAAGGKKEEGPIVLKLWSMQQSDRRVVENQNYVIQEFQKQYPNVTLELEVTPYSAYRDKLLVAAKGGNPPDISVVDKFGTLSSQQRVSSSPWTIIWMGRRPSRSSSSPVRGIQRCTRTRYGESPWTSVHGNFCTTTLTCSKRRG